MVQYDHQTDARVDELDGGIMANELQQLSKVFSHRVFRIPDYQRGYAWQQSQLIDFWDDLVNLQEDKYHYTGMLSLKALSKKDTSGWGTDTWLIDSGDYEAFYIVDGQQRLTTFVILINELVCFVRELPENKDLSDDKILLGFDTLSSVVEKYICRHRPPNNLITTYLFGYEVDNPSADYLRYRVFNEPYSGSVDETYYTKNLKNAKNFFRSNLESFYEQEKMAGISVLYKKLTQQMMFNIHEISDDYDVFVAFETMNNRGKKLTNLELLKNRLIYLTTLYSNDAFDELEKANLRKKINDAWKEVYYHLGKNEEWPLSDDDFLRAHWISYYSYSRRKGDDYIKFLLSKFSAKNIFEKVSVTTEDDSQVLSDVDDDDQDDDEVEVEPLVLSKLQPTEISDYVLSLMDMAQYWYDTFFPMTSEHLTPDERIWVDRLQRVGIGYFRPLVMVAISKRKISPEKRSELFKAIERFIFICFRLGGFNASYQSSEYYRCTRSLYFDEISIDDLIKDLSEKADANIEYAVPNFVTKIEKNFSNHSGFYGWGYNLKYFLYEYEYTLAKKNNIDKISWEMFSKNEKDKVSIEHIFPQTHTNYYWRNQFRQFDDDEKEMLAGALGNLLPLSQSINSSLQNVSFYDKKTSNDKGRRGYENGSHSEIEVAKEQDWDAKKIYDRSKKLLRFMEQRWEISFSQEQMDRLVYVQFAVDGREIPPELPAPSESETVDDPANIFDPSNDDVTLRDKRRKFWTDFVEYCRENGRGSDIAYRNPRGTNWYDISTIAEDFHISFTITRSKFITILLYVYTPEAFARLEDKKIDIESKFGDKLDWYSSRENSVAKRILYKKEADIFNPEKQKEIYEWMVTKYDALVEALNSVGEEAGCNPKPTWKGVTAEDVQAAIDRFLEERPEYPEPSSIWLVYNGEELPAKHIKGMAWKEAYGTEIDKSEYVSGDTAVRFFERRGFTIVRKGDD